MGVDAILVTDIVNVRYLTGFTGSNGRLLMGTSDGVFFTDSRYTEQSRREVSESDLEQVTYEDPFEAVLVQSCARGGVMRLGFESTDLRYKSWQVLTEELEGVELVPMDQPVQRLRRVKDPSELRLIEQAQEAADQAFDAILDRIALGVTEQQVAIELELAMRRAGADGPSFRSIVAFGGNAAEPHHRPSHRALEEGDVIKMDFGALSSGYHSDMTRTISFGEPPAELRKIHDIVREAQQVGIDAVRAGARAREVDLAARMVIEEAGYGERFGHGLGHGVGLQIHEGPWFHAKSEDVLPAGAVMTVEPGIYVPGLGGVRIEDMVEVTGEGCRAIATSTRELIEL